MRNTTTTAAIILAILFGAITCPALGHQVYEIRQDRYTFRMPVTKTVTTETFIIAKKNTGSASNKAISKQLETTFEKHSIRSVSCHFSFDSAVLLSSEAEKLLANLPPGSKSLVVTGYTCPLGPEKHNQALSLQRARAVAAFLRSHGYGVAAVQGKGSQEPVTSNPARYYLNRRVTVQITPEGKTQHGGEK